MGVKDSAQGVRSQDIAADLSLRTNPQKASPIQQQARCLPYVGRPLLELDGYMGWSTRHALQSRSLHCLVPNECMSSATQVSGIAASTDARRFLGGGADGQLLPKAADAERSDVAKPIKALMLGGVAVIFVGIGVGEGGDNAWGKVIAATGALLYVMGRLFAWSLAWCPRHAGIPANSALESQHLRVPAASVVKGRRHQGLRARRALNALERAARFRIQRGDRLAQRASAGGWWVV